MVNNGHDYELFVRSLYEALIRSESIGEQHNIVIELNKKLRDRNGIEREFDLYWEYELAGITYKTIVECKDYSRPVSIDKIDALIGKISDFPDIKPLFATKIGYQSGAEAKAKKSNIDLLIVREQNDTDWFDENGTPLIKRIVQTICMVPPAVITSFQPFLDGDWMKDKGFDEFDSNFGAPSNEIFINDVETGEKYSLYDLGHKLGPQLTPGEKPTILPGSYNEEVLFKNAFIEYEDKSYKLRAYKISYNISPPAEFKSTLDFGDQLIGVIEYLEKGTKKKIFRDRIAN